MLDSVIHALEPRRLGLRLAVLLAVGLASGSASADTVYVDSSVRVGGDGSSWGEAYRRVQDALAASIPGDHLWVAAGTYTPAEANGNRLASFVLPDGVSLYGGFVGNESELRQRDPVANPTILSGDLNGNDGADFANSDENSYHVVVASELGLGSSLDGFTITGGHADGENDPTCFGGDNNHLPCVDDGDCAGEDAICASIDSKGAGLLVMESDISIVNCRIEGNYAAFQGGGLFMHGSVGAITGSTFEGNRAEDNGGAMYLGGSSPEITGTDYFDNEGGRYAGAACLRDMSNPTFNDCMFSGNTAAETLDDPATGGGAIVHASSSPVFNDCQFVGNAALLGNGGAVYTKLGFDEDLGSSFPTFNDCSFDGNWGFEKGGVLYNTDASGATLNNCTLTNNQAEKGGAFYTDGESTPALNDCEFIANTAQKGAAMYNDHGHPTVTGSLFDNGMAFIGVDGNTGYGGVLYNVDSFPVFENSTFTANHAERFGGVLYSANLSEPLFKGCTFETNIAELGGGVANVNNGSAITFEKSTFRHNENQSRFFGGSVLMLLTGEANFRDCMFADNTSNMMGVISAIVADTNVSVTNCVFDNNIGGALLIDGLEGQFNQVTMTNCTIVNDEIISGIENTFGELNIANSIIWGMFINDGGDTTVSYGNLQFGFAGAGNIAADPLFVDPAAGDYRLQAGSPSIDAGSNLAVPEGVTIDLDGERRFVDDPDAADVGEGRAPLVDMGAYERQVGAPCLGDIDGDNVVSTPDLLFLLGAWGPCADCDGCLADLNDDCSVGTSDLLLLLGAWGACD